MTLLESSVILFCFATICLSTDYRYDRYSGKATNPENYGRPNNTNCTIIVKHCAAHEGSRVDGTCNNYKYPTRGSARGPYLRLLNPDYSNDNQDIRKDRDGGELPSARRVRTTLQTDGRVVDKHDFTIAAFHYLQFIHLDVSLLNGPMDYLVNRPYCCQPEGQLDPRCKPIIVPNDDPYLRVTDIRCLNFSRAESFQDDGCLNETYPPEQINFQTPVIDLSTIYGVDERGQNAVRVYKYGLLKLEYRDFRHVPLANQSAALIDPFSLLALLDPTIIANLTDLSQQMLNLTMSNSSMWGNMTMQNRQMFMNSSMLQSTSLQKSQIFGSPVTLDSKNMVAVLSMLQNLAMLNPQMLNNLTVLNPEVLGNFNILNQQMLGSLSKLQPAMLANLMQLNPHLLGTLAMLGNMTAPKFGNVTSRSRRQLPITVPVSLPTTGGIIDAITSPVLAQVDEVTPTVMSLINMTNLNKTLCLQNMSNETRCYVFGFPEAGNFDLRTTTFAIFFMREHNRLARALHKLNPCWKDDRLFKVARQINIATASNILMYELLPMILGHKNMLKYGLISEHVQHVTAYDEDAVPLVYSEFEIAFRYYHTMLEGRIKLYDENYHYEGELSVSNTTYRQSVIEQDKNFEKINRGTFYQHAAKIDDIQDPEISEKYYGDLQRAADLSSLDIQRGRDLGVRGYNDYRHLCGLKPAKKFEDFEDVMDHEKIEALKRLYVRIEDVDLLAGIMSENFIHEAFAGPTLFCIITKQLQLFRFSDRFWFERGDQFHSLTLPQLHEVRKTNIARFACDNADAIKFIQPRAFKNVGPHNTHVPCTHVPGLDITKWQDNSCYNDKLHHNHQDKINENEALISDNRNGKYALKNKNVHKIHWSIDANGKHEDGTHWPLPNGSKAKDDTSWTISEDGKSIKPHVIRWSMNLNNKNENTHINMYEQNDKHKEELNHNLHDKEGKLKDEMYLHLSKTTPQMHWSINKYDKHEGAVYGPLKKDEKEDFLALKYWDTEDDNAKYKKVILFRPYEDNGKNKEEKYQLKTEDDGKYRGELYGQVTQNVGKYDNRPDWPLNDKHKNEWINRQQHYEIPQKPNSPVFPSTSHQHYQPDAGDLDQFFQTLIPI